MLFNKALADQDEDVTFHVFSAAEYDNLADAARALKIFARLNSLAVSAMRAENEGMVEDDEEILKALGDAIDYLGLQIYGYFDHGINKALRRAFEPRPQDKGLIHGSRPRHGEAEVEGSSGVRALRGGR